MPKEIIDFLRLEVGREVWRQSLEHKKFRDYLTAQGIVPEPVTEPPGDEPIGGEAASLRGKSKTVEEFCARNNLTLPGLDWEGAWVRARKIVEDILEKYGPHKEPERTEARRAMEASLKYEQLQAWNKLLPPDEPIAKERKPSRAAKKKK